MSQSRSSSISRRHARKDAEAVFACLKHAAWRSCALQAATLMVHGTAAGEYGDGQ